MLRAHPTPSVLDPWFSNETVSQDSRPVTRPPIERGFYAIPCHTRPDQPHGMVPGSSFPSYGRIVATVPARRRGTSCPGSEQSVGVAAPRTDRPRSGHIGPLAPPMPRAHWRFYSGKALRAPSHVGTSGGAGLGPSHASGHVGPHVPDCDSRASQVDGVHRLCGRTALGRRWRKIHDARPIWAQIAATTTAARTAGIVVGADVRRGRLGV